MADAPRGAAGALVAPGAAARGGRPRAGGAGQRHDAVALAQSGRAAALAASELDLPPRSGVRAQSRPDPGSLRTALAGSAPWTARLRGVRRRKNQCPGPSAQAPLAAARPGPADAHRTRVRAGRGLVLPRRLGRASGPRIRPV